MKWLRLLWAFLGTFLGWKQGEAGQVQQDKAKEIDRETEKKKQDIDAASGDDLDRRIDEL